MAEELEVATELAEERCVACRKDSPRVEVAEAADLLGHLAGWAIVELGEVPRLQRTFRFRKYVEALSFVQRVGELAEVEGHHPVMTVEPRRVTVTWWTHAIGALHRNDFLMAAKTDRLASAD
jgi:4a-hydroxytetrahydrobiopterin dehydratase